MKMDLFVYCIDQIEYIKFQKKSCLISIIIFLLPNMSYVLIINKINHPF